MFRTIGFVLVAVLAPTSKLVLLAAQSQLYSDTTEKTKTKGPGMSDSRAWMSYEAEESADMGCEVCSEVNTSKGNSPICAVGC